MRLPLPSTPEYDPVPPGEDLFQKQQDITHPWLDDHVKKVLSNNGLTITQKILRYFRKLLIGALLATTALSNAWAMQPSFDPSIPPGSQMVQLEKHAWTKEQDDQYTQLRERKFKEGLEKAQRERWEQYRLQKEQRWQQMRDSVAELSEADQVFVQAEVLLRPGISDLPDVSVYEFVERILHSPLDQWNNQLPRLIQIVKRDNEYTVDIQMKNHVSLLFRHDLSPPANGRTAMLQSVITTVTFARGHKVDPPELLELTPLEFVTFMAATPGWNASLNWQQQQQPQRWPKFNTDPQQQQQPVQQPQQVKPKYSPGPGMTEEENHITRLPTEQIEDPNVLRDPITQKPLSDDAKAEQEVQRQLQ